MRSVWRLLALSARLAAALALAACSAQPAPSPATAAPAPPAAATPTDQPEPATRQPAGRYTAYEIITVLPRDAISAVFEPGFVTAEAAAEMYAPDELVIGVVFNGQARAYSIPYLSRREIVNDEVGGVKIAVTW